MEKDMYGAGLFDGPADYEQDMRGGTPTRGWGGQGQGYGTPTGEWRGRGGTPMGDRMTPMGWGGRGGTPMGDRMTPMGYERESMTPVEWREESVGVSMERREGGVSGSRRERGKRSRVLERNGDYEAKLFGGIPSQVLTDFHGDEDTFSCEIDIPTGLGYCVSRTKVMLWSCADGGKRFFVLEDGQNPLIGRGGGKGDLLPALISATPSPDKSIHVFASSTCGDLFLWSTHSPSSRSRPLAVGKVGGVGGGGVRDVVGLNEEVVDGKMDYLVGGGGGGLWVVSVETLSQFHIKKLEKGSGYFSRMWWGGGNGETGIVKFIAIPNNNNKKKTRVLVLREDRVESWLFYLPSRIEENTMTLEWEVQLSSLMGGPTTWLDICQANNTTIVLLAEKQGGGLFLVPLCLTGEGEGGLTGEGGGKGCCGKGAMEVPGGRGRGGECRLLGVNGNETVCVVWRDACLLAHITPKPTDGQEAPIKDPLTFSGSYFTPPGAILGCGTTPNFSLFVCQTGEMVQMTPTAQRAIALPFLFDGQHIMDKERCWARLEEVCKEAEKRERRAGGGGEGGYYPLAKGCDVGKVVGWVVEWVEKSMKVEEAKSRPTHKFTSGNVSGSPTLEALHKKMHHFWCLIGAPMVGRQGILEDSLWAVMEEEERGVVGGLMEMLEGAVALKGFRSRLIMEDYKKQRDPTWKSSPEGALCSFFSVKVEEIYDIASFALYLERLVRNFKGWCESGQCRGEVGGVMGVMMKGLIETLQAAHKFHRDYLSPQFLYSHPRSPRPPSFFAGERGRERDYVCGGSLIWLWGENRSFLTCLLDFVHFIIRVVVGKEEPRDMDLLPRLTSLTIFCLDAYIEERGTVEGRGEREEVVLRELVELLGRYKFNWLIDLGERYYLCDVIVRICDANAGSISPYLAKERLRDSITESLFEYLFLCRDYHKLILLPLELNNTGTLPPEQIGAIRTRLRQFLKEKLPSSVWMFDAQYEDYELCEISLLREEKTENVSLKRSQTLLHLSKLCAIVQEDDADDEDEEQSPKPKKEIDVEGAIRRGADREEVESIIDEKRDKIREIEIIIRTMQYTLAEKLYIMLDKRGDDERGRLKGLLNELRRPLNALELADKYVKSAEFDDEENVAQNYGFLFDIVYLFYECDANWEPLMDHAIEWLWNTQPTSFDSIPRDQAIYDHMVSETVTIQVIHNFLQQQKESEEREEGEGEGGRREEERRMRGRFLREFLGREEGKGFLKKVNEAFGRNEGLDQFLSTLFRHLEVVFMSVEE